MADKETGLNIEVNAVANEKSAEQAVNKLADGVEKASKKGRIEVPVSINTLIDNKDTESKLSKAQKDVVKAINKMSKKGFSASAKDIDALNSKMTEFGHQMDQAGKGRQNKVFREIRKQVDELNKSYKALQLDTKSARVRDTKTSRSKSKPRRKQDKFNPDFGPVSDESIEASTRQHQKRQLKGLKSVTQGLGYRNKGIDPGKTSVHMMKLSEYSAHGSNWANELARTLKEEMKKSAKTLVKYIDPVAAKNAKSGRPTDEKTFLNAVIKNVLGKLTDSITKLEAGDKTITLDTLKEQAATIKVLSNNAGKTTEQAMKAINGAIQSVYSETEDPKRRHRLGGTGREEGTEKGVGPGHELAKSLQNQLYKSMNAWNDEATADVIAKEIALGTDKVVKEIKKDTKRTKTSQANKKVDELKSTDKYKADIAKLNAATNKTHAEIRNSMKATKDTTKAIDRNTAYDKVENVAERVADTKQQNIESVNRDINKDTAGAVKEDVKTGFNTDTKAEELINTIESDSKKPIEVNSSSDSILAIISANVKAILKSLGGVPVSETAKKRYIKKKESEPEEEKNVFHMRSAEDKMLPMALKTALAPVGEQAMAVVKNALVPIEGTLKTIYKYDTPRGADSKGEYVKLFNEQKQREENAKKKSSRLEKSEITASPIHPTIWNKLEDKINDITGATEEYKKVINATADAQDDFAAERIKKYGLNNGRNPNDTGDIASIRRALELFRTNKRSIEDNEELSQKIQLTEGVKIDTTEVTKAFNKVLSGKQMRNAQMGGSIPRNILGAFTGFAGMPSIEKSRAQADGLNQIMGNINKALNSVLSSIQMKETELSGLEKSGQAKFDDNGNMTYGTSAAKKTFVDLEEYKLVLQTILADMNMVDDIVDSTNGKFGKLVKRLNFTSPVLRENNDILRNINAGLDKGGKALKFQTRWAEILNYTFQLISRSVGQWVKKVLSMLNPFNILKNTIKGIVGLTKNLFSDFASYDTKWQRTMNVIKINFQRVMKPAMEWIAQKIVNIIGYFDVASQAFQRVFGKIPISLFDQAGADAEKIRREMEEAANVTLGFDELHDIGTDQSGANDLLGDIYKPQLDPKWVEQFDKLGEVLGKFFKGDLGFGDVCKQILKMLGMLLGDIGKAIWDWFKETAIGKWITEHWKGLLASLLAIFLGWQLLKIFGPTLLSVIGGAFKTLLGKVGGWLTTLLGASGFGQGIMLAFQSLFAGGKYSLIGTLKEMFTNSAAITEAGSWGSMIGFALVKALVGTISIALGGKVLADAFDSSADKASYNIGLKQNGGKDSDKKGNGWDIAKGAAGGAAIGFGIGQIIPVVGPAVGAAIGAVVGALTTALAPAFEEVTVKAKEMNNEMQKTEYYEGVVQGLTTQTNIYDEQLKLLKESLDLSTQSVYDQGEKLGISRTRMDELIKSTQDGTFNTEMLTGKEVELSDSLTNLAQKQEHVTEVSGKLEEAQKKLLKAQTDLSIAQDVEAGNFELAAARIEVAEAQGVYSTEEATAKRIQLYKQGGEEERKNLLQNLTPEQRKLMMNYNDATDKELAELAKLWRESSDDVRDSLLAGVDDNTINDFKGQMSKIDEEIKSHQGFWQGVGDTIKEIFTFGQADTWTYNGEAKYYKDKNKVRIQKNAVGTNYVEADGLQYLHQGEAIIPKKYNQPYQPGGMSPEERAYMERMIATMNKLDGTIASGINVKGEFRQRGNDLVATVEKNKNKQSNNVLNNKVYAR